MIDDGSIDITLHDIENDRTRRNKAEIHKYFKTFF